MGSNPPGPGAPGGPPRSQGVIVANVGLAPGGPHLLAPGGPQLMASGGAQVQAPGGPQLQAPDVLEEVRRRLGPGWALWRGVGGLLATRGGLLATIAPHPGGLRVVRERVAREHLGELVVGLEEVAGLLEVQRCQGRREEEVLPLLATFPSPSLLTALFLIEKQDQV